MPDLDPDVQAWRAAWLEPTAQSPAPPTEALVRLVRRRGRWLHVTMIAEMAISLIALVAVTAIAVVESDPVERLAMAALAIIAAAAGVFSHVNWRHMQTPIAATTSEYLALAAARCQRLQRGVRAGWAVLAAEALVFVPWLWYRSGTPPSIADWPWNFLAAMLAAGAVAVLLLDRWSRRERRIVEELNEELELVRSARRT
jgi:hypothetical protein